MGAPARGKRRAPSDAELTRLDILCSYGPRRPDWTREGLSPSVREYSEMCAHREWVTRDGYSSIQAAPAYHSARIWGPIVSTIKTAIVAIAARFGLQIGEPGAPAPQAPAQKPAPIPRPPGMPDDHPLILNGRYQ